MKCTNCGKDLNPNSKFCDNCGASVQFQPVQPMQNTTVPTAQGSAPQPKKEPWYMNKKIVLHFPILFLRVLLIFFADIVKILLVIV